MNKSHEIKDALIRDKTVWIDKLLQRNEQLEEENAELLKALGVIVIIFDSGGTIDEVGREATEAIRKFSR